MCEAEESKEGNKSFVQTISLICPNCMKEVTVKSSLERGYLQWIEKPLHNEECPFAFHLQRHLPKISEKITVSHPLIFIVLNSKLGTTESIKRIRRLMAAERDEGKRALYAKRVKRQESLLSADLDEILEKALNAIKTGLFGLRLYVGHRVFAYLWKWSNKYFGIARNETEDYIPYNWILATKEFSEAEKFMHELLHHYDHV